MIEESFFDLLSQATEMLKDRHKIEADLIYSIAKLEPDLRSALILAYQLLYENPEK